eukprot:scaffold75419_cov24-Tisochrysis_lutea.AAC.1
MAATQAAPQQTTDTELDLESVRELFALVASSSDEEERIDALEQLSDTVNSAYNEDGAAIGAVARQCGGVQLLADLILDRSLALQQEALVLLGNLCSDAVDPLSAETKAMLYQAGAAPGIVTCLDSPEESIVMCVCGALQNLCHDALWAKAVHKLGAHARLESLSRSQDSMVARYAAGALKNMAVRLQSEQALLTAFRQKRAFRVISKYAKDIAPEARLRRYLASTGDATAIRAQTKVVHDFHEKSKQRRSSLPSPTHVIVDASNIGSIDGEDGTSVRAPVSASSLQTGGTMRAPNTPRPSEPAGIRSSPVNEAAMPTFKAVQASSDAERACLLPNEVTGLGSSGMTSSVPGPEGKLALVPHVGKAELSRMMSADIAELEAVEAELTKAAMAAAEAVTAEASANLAAARVAANKAAVEAAAAAATAKALTTLGDTADAAGHDPVAGRQVQAAATAPAGVDSPPELMPTPQVADTVANDSHSTAAPESAKPVDEENKPDPPASPMAPTKASAAVDERVTANAEGVGARTEVIEARTVTHATSKEAVHEVLTQAASSEVAAVESFTAEATAAEATATEATVVETAAALEVEAAPETVVASAVLETSAAEPTMVAAPRAVEVIVVAEMAATMAAALSEGAAEEE